jgi:hypothetical protein
MLDELFQPESQVHHPGVQVLFGQGVAAPLDPKMQQAVIHARLNQACIHLIEMAENQEKGVQPALESP